MTGCSLLPRGGSSVAQQPWLNHWFIAGGKAQRRPVRVPGHTEGQEASPCALCSSHLIRRFVQQIVRLQQTCPGDTDPSSWFAHSRIEEAEVQLLQARVTQALMEVAQGIVGLGKASPSWDIREVFQRNCRNGVVGRTKALRVESRRRQQLAHHFSFGPALRPAMCCTRLLAQR